MHCAEIGLAPSESGWVYLVQKIGEWTPGIFLNESGDCH